MKENEMGEHAAHTEEIRNAHKIFIENLKGRTTLKT
jgi:hypothetical protein